MPRLVIVQASISILLLCASVHAQQASAEINMDRVYRKWTGDLDGMVQRRVIRALVAYNKMTYFIDHGTQRGFAYDQMTEFANEVNKKMNLGKLRVNVFFIPVSRDQILRDLAEGKGDIAMASLTITPEREKLVDFAEPLTKISSEIVVTGSGGPNITNAEDLSGKEVFVRKSSS